MLFATQMALSDRLNMIGQLNPLHVKIARNFVGFVELVAGIIQGFRLSGTTAPLLLSVMIIDLLWTIMGIECNVLSAFTKAHDTFRQVSGTDCR